MMDETKLLGRRQWCAAGLGAAAFGAAAVGASATEPGEPKEPAEPTLKSQFLFEMEAELEPPEDIGNRQIHIAKSGVIRGPRINATLLPGGGDWAKRRPDGSTMLDVRGTMKTDDGALIYTWYHGIIAPKEGGMYFRTTPYFETKSEKYGWLNHIVAVGVFKPVPGKVAYNVFEIL